MGRSLGSVNKNKKPFCKNGHDISVTGRNSFGVCIGCHRLNNWERARCAKAQSQSKQSHWAIEGCKNKDGTTFTLNDYNRLFQIQGGHCKICNKHQSELKKSLCVDHSHDTGVVRGLLCNDCNLNIVGRHTEETARVLIKYFNEGKSV